MKNSRMKKLTLNKETLRNLQDSELALVMGGAAHAGQPAAQIARAIRVTAMCPHPSTSGTGFGLNDALNDESPISAMPND